MTQHHYDTLRMTRLRHDTIITRHDYDTTRHDPIATPALGSRNSWTPSHFVWLSFYTQFFLSKHHLLYYLTLILLYSSIFIHLFKPYN